MEIGLIVDTGPLVALLDHRDRRHAWTTSILEATRVPLATCEAVVSEACFVARHAGVHADTVCELVSGLCRGPMLRWSDEESAIRRLLAKYRSVPMSFADACLVRMSEMHPKARVLTFDGDFRVYRRNGRHVVPTLMPTR